jgi:hypothetical protein
MLKRSQVLVAVLGVLALGATLRADWKPVSLTDGGQAQSSRACIAADEHGANPSGPFDCPAIAGPDLLSVTSLPGLNGDVGQAPQTQPVQILSEEHNSLSLCLCALLGVGLWKAPVCVKKLHFGVIPDWYHDAGPAQVGHSLANSPDCVCCALICFVQPEVRAQDITPGYRREVIVALWRIAQFTPTVDAPRGPPSMS